jgi:hypothetical protein
VAHYQVYISSTYRDLKPYREMVMNTLLKVDNFHVVGMEHYTAESMQPLDRCLDDVAQCNIYLLILANRYGYVMPGDERSITHQEYLKALELKKTVLVFKADNRDGQFMPDEEEAGQPSPAQKAAKLDAFRTAVSQAYLSHPTGFTSPHHLALQVMESLARNKSVDYDGDELSEECRIFCDRNAAVSDFQILTKQQQPFSAFLIQGDRPNLPDSVVERLSKYYLNITNDGPLQVKYYDHLGDALYWKFEQRVLNDLCQDFQLTGAAQPPLDATSVLRAVKASGISTLALWSSASDSLQWEKGYEFLNTLFAELARASTAIGGIYVYWFLTIDVADTLKQELKVGITETPALTAVSTNHIEEWIREHVYYNGKKIAADVLFSLRQLCFSSAAGNELLTMSQAQSQIRKFIRRYNARRKVNDEELLDLVP